MSNTNSNTNSKGQIIEELDVAYYDVKLNCDPVINYESEILEWCEKYLECKSSLSKKVPLINSVAETELLSWCEVYLNAKKNKL